MNLFIATSPFQLICAIEAREHYKLKNNVLAITPQPIEKSQKQFDLLLKPSDWDSIIELPTRGKLITLPRFIRKIKKLGCIDNIIYAEYESWRLNVMLSNINVKNEIMIDDGSLTIKIYETLLKDKGTFSRKKWAKDLILNIMGIKTNKIIKFRDNFELFSIFQFYKANIKTKLNKLDTLSESISQYKLFNPEAFAGFIGQGIVNEEHGIKLNAYIELLKSLYDLNKRSIIYFPHRSESIAVRTEIQKLPFIKYHDSEMPLEMEIYDKKIQLSSISGIYSTALYTLSLLYKDIPTYNIQQKPSYYNDSGLIDGYNKIEHYYNNEKIKPLSF